MSHMWELLIHYRALSLAFVARFARASYICFLFIYFFTPQFFLYQEHVIKNSRGLTFSSPLWPVLQEQVTFISCLPLLFQCAFNIIGNIVGLMQYMGLLCGYVGLYCGCIRISAQERMYQALLRMYQAFSSVSYENENFMSVQSYWYKSNKRV